MGSLIESAIVSLESTSLLVWATGGGAGTAPAEGGGLMSMIPLMIFLYVVFYILLIRPQRKQQQAHDRLLKELKKNDSVRTSGGIFGKIHSVDGDQDQVVLKIDDQQNVKIRVLRSSIVAVLNKDGEPATAGASGKK